MSKTIKLSLITAAFLSSLQAQTAYTLDTITVTSATKTAQSIKDVTSNISVLTGEDIKERGFSTVTDAINSMAGVSFTQSGGMGQQASVFVRGFSSNRVLVLIDGVRYNDITGPSGAPFEHLMISDIKQIEVVKGAQSGIWGADATAGVINIITKGAKKGLHGSVNAEYGSYKSKKLGVMASYKEKNYYIKFSSQKVETDGFSAQAPKGANVDDFEDDGYTNTTSSIKLGFNINETNKIDISHTYVDAKSEYDDFIPDSNWVKDDVASANSVAKSTTKDHFTKINFHHVDSFNEIDIYVNRSIFSREYSYGDFDGEVYEYGLKSNISYREKDFLVWGIDYKTFEHKNDLNKEYNNKAFFLTNSNHFNGFSGGKNIVTQSIRVDSYDKFDNKVTGKFGIKHIVDKIDGLSASINYGTAYNVPTLYNLYAPATSWGAVGNENLTPESTTSFDISVEYKAVKLTYFSSDIEDMIGWGSGFENIDGTSTIKGFELEYAQNVTDDLYLSLNYTKLTAEDKDGKALARRAESQADISATYYVLDDLNVGLNAQYIGERFDSADKQGEQTGKYTVANFITNYTLNKNLSFYAKVDNLTDKKYQTVDGYATAERSFYLGLNAKY